jgi:hypothetical protein
MFTLNIVFLCLLIIGMVILARAIIVNRQLENQNSFISHQLDQIQSFMAIDAKKIAKKNSGLNSLEEPGLDSPAVLGTIITVVIKKTGALRLCLDDFIEVGDEHVSIYVDTATNELILSLNPSLTDDDMELLKFGLHPDDKIYH